MDPLTFPPEPEQRPQFSLKSIFAATAVIAVILGALCWFGFWPTIGLLLVAIATITAYAVPTRRASKWIGVAAVLSITALILLIFHSSSPRARQVAVLRVGET